MNYLRIIIAAIVMLFCGSGFLEAQGPTGSAPAAKRTIWSRMFCVGPHGELPHVYAFDINRKYGFQMLRIYFCRDKPDGTTDLADADIWLNSAYNMPYGCRVIINREGWDWLCWDGNTARSKPDVIQKRVDLMRYFRDRRPDVEFAYFACVPHSIWSYELSADPKLENQSYRLGMDLKPIAETSSYLNPEFYMDSRLTIEQTTKWIHQVLSRTRTLYPDKKLMPYFWPHWYDVWLKMQPECDQPDFKWTPEALAKARIPGDYWRKTLDAISDCGVDNVAIWMQGYVPWDDEAPWFLATLEWRKGN